MWKKKSFKNTIKRAKSGELREYWLQLYIKENWKKLGLDSLEGPFETGYDFKGVHKGKKVTIEAERTIKDFIYHNHNPRKVDILVVLNDEATDKVRGMEPAEWKKRLPKRIIKVDAEDVIKSTHKARKDYAIKAKERRKEEEEMMKWCIPFSIIKTSFATLWSCLIEEEVPLLYTPEAEVFDDALESVTIQYINFYSLNLRILKKMWKGVFPRIVTLANDLIKSRREFIHFTEEEKRFVKEWLNLLHKEYCSRL